MDRWRTKTFRTDDVTSKRIDELAASEDRSISKMLDILVQEALNDRECRELAKITGGRSDGPPGAEVE